MTARDRRLRPGRSALHPQQPLPAVLRSRRSDAQGNTAQRDFYFEGEYSRGERPAAPGKAGLPGRRDHEADHAHLPAAAARSTWISSAKGRRSARAAWRSSDGQAEVVVDLTPDLYGTLELHAYKILPSGSITRDTRLVVVDDADDLSVISLTPGQDTYRPGDTASAGHPGAAGRMARACRPRWAWRSSMNRSLPWPSRTPALPSCTSCSNRSCCSPSTTCTASASPTWCSGAARWTTRRCAAPSKTPPRPRWPMAAASRQRLQPAAPTRTQDALQARRRAAGAAIFSGLSKCLLTFCLAPAAGACSA